ncbi:MAG: rhomboid family intramembrane serine protease [Pseudomonadota bacterium]
MALLKTGLQDLGIIELLLEHWFHIPIISFLQLYPIQHRYFHTWQLITHPFIHDPGSPVSFLITCLMFYFFAGPVERAIGGKRFLAVYFGSAAGATIIGLALTCVPVFNVPFLGMMPSLLSLMVIFGLLNPEATILLMLIVPVKAKYISYGTIIIAFLTFLAKANPYAAYHLGGILIGYIYSIRPQGKTAANILWLKYSKWHSGKKRSRFIVIEGNRQGNKEKRKTYH